MCNGEVKHKFQKKKDFVWCNVIDTLCYGLPSVSFLTRHARKLNYILGYNLKIRRGQKSKTKTVNMHAKNCLCTLFSNDILVAF